MNLASERIFRVACCFCGRLVDVPEEHPLADCPGCGHRFCVVRMEGTRAEIKLSERAKNFYQRTGGVA